MRKRSKEFGGRYRWEIAGEIKGRISKEIGGKIGGKIGGRSGDLREADLFTIAPSVATSTLHATSRPGHAEAAGFSAIALPCVGVARPLEVSEGLRLSLPPFESRPRGVPEPSVFESRPLGPGDISALDGRLPPRPIALEMRFVIDIERFMPSSVPMPPPAVMTALPAAKPSDSRSRKVRHVSKVGSCAQMASATAEQI